MPGTTTELNLSTAVDSDDNADYLTINLANSLRTLDGLFNNVTGHSHAAAHQGGPIGNIPASAIPNGLITSAMIADGTITAADIANGTVTAAQLAAGAATAAGGIISGGSGSSPATSPGVINPGFATTVTLLGGLPVLVIMSYTWTNSAASVANFMDILIDGATWYTIGRHDYGGANAFTTTASMMLFQVGGGAPGFAAGAHTFNPGWHCTGGTMSLGANPWLFMFIAELRR